MLKTLLLKLIGSSWVTTVLGWLATTIGCNYVDFTDPATHAVAWGKVVLAVLAFLIFRAMKDARITGGTTSVPTVPNPPAMVPNPSAIAQ